jgi:hypothetical protein
MAYADFVHPDAPMIRTQASGSYLFANGEALGLSNTRTDYDKQGPVCIIKMGPADYRCWIEGVALAPVNGGPRSYNRDATQTGDFDADTIVIYGTSTDGLTWTFRDTAAAGTPDPIVNPYLPTNPSGGNTGWMRGESSVGRVLFDPDEQIWKLWGHGGNNTGPRQIYYMTSPDGIAWTFQNSGQPIMAPGAAGAWDDTSVTCDSLVKISPTSYVMLYRSNRATTFTQIGRATSSDGITWTKYGTAAVLAGSGSGWDSDGVYGSGLAYDPSTGHMHLWYCGDSPGGLNGSAMGYAWSDDLGITWVRSPLNPLLVPSAAGLDTAQIGDSVGIYRDGNSYRIQYGVDKPTPNGLSGYFRGRLQAATFAAPLAPTLVGVGTAQWTATNGATFAPGLPSGWQPDDIHVLIAHRSENTAMTALAGWTQIAGLSGNNTTGQRVEVWWRRAVAGDAAPTVTFGTSTIVRGGVIFGVRGCPRDVSPFNLSSRLDQTANTTVNTTDISPATAPTLGVFAYAYEDDPSAASTWVGPNDQVGWTPFTVQTTPLGTDAAIGVCSRKWGQSGSWSAPTTTVSGGTFAASPNVGLLFAFDPLPVAPFPPFPRRVITLRR